MVIGTLGKVGGIVGGWLEPTCDGSTNQASSCYSWSSLDAYVAKAQTNGLTIVYDFSIPGVDVRQPRPWQWMHHVAHESNSLVKFRDRSSDKI
jgi:hypothetical protein